MNEVLEVKKGEVSKILDFIHENIDGQKLDARQKVEGRLIAEEALIKLDDATDEGKTVRISIRRHFGYTILTITSHGKEVDLYEGAFFEDVTSANVDMEGTSADTEEEIRSMLLKAFEDRIDYSHKKHVNRVQITIAKSRYLSLFRTLMGMSLGIIIGLIFSALLPEDACDWIDDNILRNITKVFMNALKIIIAPVVFFSIVTSVSGFGNMRELGRIGLKTVGFYMMTSVIAITLGTLAYMFLQVGDPSLSAEMTNDVSKITDAASSTSISLVDTIINIVPDNFIKPFFNSDMLQVIFLAIICGITVALLGKKAKLMGDFFDCCNSMFMKITTIFMKFIPVATFCSMCSMIVTTGLHSFLSLLTIVGGFILCVLLMICVYMILLAVLGRVNPFNVLKKYFPTMLTVFSICSSNACIPLNMNTCRDGLGIHPRVYSLTIPLGATINMDGASIALSFFTLAFCHIFGVEVNAEMLLPVLVMILLLSIGAPGIPNAGLVLLAMLTEQVNVPVAAVSLVMGIWPIVDMFSTANNCLGDVVGTLVVARSENLVDMDVLNSK